MYLNTKTFSLMCVALMFVHTVYGAAIDTNGYALTNETALGDIDMAATTVGDFKKVIVPDSIFEIKNRLKELGAINSLMTGSGSAVFGVFESEELAIKVKNDLELIYDNVYFARSVNRW